MNQVEIEVKFYLPDIAPIRNRIVETGARSQGRTLETNLRFEDKDRSLIRKRSLLRLRRDRRVRLTFKSPPPEEDPRFKVHRELEVEVGDFAVMETILEAIGFHREQAYEKWRETFALQGAELCLDALPFGDFLEIEAAGETILEMVRTLGLRWEDRILKNYLEIFDIIRRELKLDFSDITFDNFREVRLNFTDYLAMVRAG